MGVGEDSPTRLSGLGATQAPESEPDPTPWGRRRVTTATEAEATVAALLNSPSTRELPPPPMPLPMRRQSPWAATATPHTPLNYLTLPKTFPSVTTRMRTFVTMTKTAETVTSAATGRRGVVWAWAGRPPPRIPPPRCPRTDRSCWRRDRNCGRRRRCPVPQSTIVEGKEVQDEEEGRGGALGGE